jgi:hypothetical protein
MAKFVYNTKMPLPYHPGRCNTNRNSPIRIALPRQVKLALSWYKNTDSIADKLCQLKAILMVAICVQVFFLPIIRNLYSFKGSQVQ